MTSLPAALSHSPPSSSSAGVRDAIASYRRSQYLAAGSSILSTADPQGRFEEPPSAFCADGTDEAADLEAGEDVTPKPHHPFYEELIWDDLDAETPKDPAQQFTLPLSQRSPRRTLTMSTSKARGHRARETTPLLRKAVSFHEAPHSRRFSYQAYDIRGGNSKLDTLAQSEVGLPLTEPTGGARYDYGGKSTFGQTLFNSTAILLGVGMLSEPLAFAYAGWICGTLLVLSYGFISCYTAKILARLMLADPRLRSYADIGLKAFGPRSTLLTSILFCLELSAVSVVLVTLYADSLHTVVPAYPADTYKLLGLIILIPTVFLPLSLLSYASVLGILSTVLIIVVVFIDGFSKRDGPGSLWSPAETSFGIDNTAHLGIAFGLFMAGFSGHAVIPSLARDMVNPHEFDRMINWAFVIATFVYSMIGYAGYLMFGNSVSDEVSVDLLNTPGYNDLLNRVALWMLVISPLTKFALTTRPINIVLETMLGAETDPQSSLEERTTSLSDGDSSKHVTQRILIGVERTLFTLFAVGISILVPDFSSVMAFLGSFSAFVICVIGPIAANIALTGRCTSFDICLLVVATVMAIWGTVAAFSAI